MRDHQWSDHVTLVGHSLGGVVEVQTLIDNPDLQPFVGGVVALDAPSVASIVDGCCWAAPGVVQRSTNSANIARSRDNGRTTTRRISLRSCNAGLRLTVIVNDDRQHRSVLIMTCGLGAPAAALDGVQGTLPLQHRLSEPWLSSRGRGA